MPVPPCWCVVVGVPGGEPTPASHRRRKGEELPARYEAHNKSHKQVRARVEHVFARARMKCWKILRRDCCLRGEGVHHAMRGIARLHDLNFVGQGTRPEGPPATPPSTQR